MTDNTVTVQDDSTVVVTEKEVSTVATSEHTSVVAVDTPEGLVTVSDTEQSVVGFDNEEVVVSVGEQGPRGARGEVGAQGFPGAGTTPPVRVNVPVGATVVIESIEMSVIRSCKWIMTTTAPFTSRYRMCEIMALHDGTESFHVIYGIFGVQVLYTVDVVAINDRMLLRVTNNDSEELVVDAVRVGNLAI